MCDVESRLCNVMMCSALNKQTDLTALDLLRKGFVEDDQDDAPVGTGIPRESVPSLIYHDHLRFSCGASLSVHD